MGKTKKAALAALTAGTVLGLGGCLNPQQLLLDAVTHAAIEFVLDNDGVFDLFEDGATAAQ